MKGVTAIAKILKIESVEYLFCFPSNPLIDEAAKVGIKPILARTERGAVNMADGYTRIAGQGRIGVIATQYGPGIENAFGGVAHAYADSIPILVLPSGTERHVTNVHPSFSATINYRNVTKWSAELNMAPRIPEMLRYAFRNLRTGKPGPVLLEIPADVYSEEISDKEFEYNPILGHKNSGDPRDIKSAVKALLSAKKPLLHVGQGVIQAEAWDELQEFAELLQIPVMTITTGKSAFPENHPLSIGNGGSTVTGMVDHFLHEADLVFGLGSTFYTSLMSCRIPAGKVLIQCTDDERDLNNEYALHHAILGNPKLVLRQLINETKSHIASMDEYCVNNVENDIAIQKKRWLEEWNPLLTSNEIPINPYRVIFELDHVLDKATTIITHDSGNPRDQLTPFYNATHPNGYIGWGNSTQLGYSLGISIGAKLAAPDKTIVHVVGDAAIGMAGLDFETSVRAEAPIITIVLNNGVMGGYRDRMPNASDQFGTHLLGGDYMKFAESMGLESERIEKPGDIQRAIETALEANRRGKSALIEIMTKEESAFSRLS